MSNLFVGLDMSLCSTGIAIIQGTQIMTDTVCTKPKNFDSPFTRVDHIITSVMGTMLPSIPTMICIEDYFTPSNRSQVGAAMKLIELGFSIRRELFWSGMPFFLIAPSQLKKFVLGKGIGAKSLILKEVYKKWDVDCNNDNEADACGLAYLAKALWDWEHNRAGTDWKKYEKAVLKTIWKDRPRYNVKEKEEE